MIKIGKIVEGLFDAIPDKTMEKISEKVDYTFDFIEGIGQRITGERITELTIGNQSLQPGKRAAKKFCSSIEKLYATLPPEDWKKIAEMSFSVAKMVVKVSPLGVVDWELVGKVADAAMNKSDIGENDLNSIDWTAVAATLLSEKKELISEKTGFSEDAINELIVLTDKIAKNNL